MKKPIFIDRDGVINKDSGGWTERGYVERWEDFIFLPRSLAALKKLNNAGYSIILVSNQAGVSKGYYTREQLNLITKNMTRDIEKSGGKIAGTYYCLHQTSDNCNCRKPKTGLLEQAQSELGIDLQGTYIIGDSKRDIEAGTKKGLRTILVLSGKAKVDDIPGWEVKPDCVFNDLMDAAAYIIESEETQL